MVRSVLVFALLFGAICAAGCRSPYYGDRGALFGGLTGAAAGAAIGDASGNAGAGAILGSAVGAITGAAIGDNIDADIARSRAEVEAKMGRQMAGAVTPDDVIAMTRAGLSEDVIATHIRAHGVARAPEVADLIYLRNQGVPDSAIKAMQSTPPPQIAQATYPGGPQPVIVEHHYDPYYPPPPPPVFFSYQRGPRFGPPPRARVGWGFSFAR
jgi:hypothetical protein